MKHAILSHLPEDFPWQVHWFETIDSTNDQAKAMAAQGAPHGTVLVAEQQTGGRGRMGRSFHSPGDAGIYLSVILRPNCPAADLMHLTCAAGVAACNAVDAVSKFRPGIKWVNDLIANGKKLGGILTELSVDPATGLVTWAVVGIGINCHASLFPASLQDVAIDLETVTGKCADRAALTAALILELERMHRQLSNKTAILDLYRKNCVTLGKEVAIIGAQATQYGTALDVDSEGALVVQFADVSVSSLSSGEVSIRPVS